MSTARLAFTSTVFLLLGLLGGPAVARAQTGSGRVRSPVRPTHVPVEVQYGQAVERIADSATVYIALAVYDGLGKGGDLDHFFLPLSRAKRVRVLAGDFEVVAPPSGMERNHEQMVRALKGLADHMDLLVRAVASGCRSELDSEGRCAEGLTSRGEMELGRLLRNGGEPALSEYTEARRRVERLLADKHVQIRPTT